MDLRKKSVFSTSGIVKNDYTRTDLACESPAPAAEAEEETVDLNGSPGEASGAAPVTVTRRREQDGGRSVTVACGRITARGEGELVPLADLLAGELRRMASEMIYSFSKIKKEIGPACRILVAGLGNAGMTPDAIGPRTVSRLTVTRHLRGYDETLFAALGCCELSAIAPGVLGQTGMESGELVKAAVELTHPDLLVAVDALAARSCDRLASTVQLSDGGICPGAGIGNHRMPLTRETMGCPVMGVGVPTVVDSCTLVLDALERAGMTAEDLPPALAEVLESGRSFIVTPRDCDEMAELTCRLLARGLDQAFGVGE